MCKFFNFLSIYVLAWTPAIIFEVIQTSGPNFDPKCFWIHGDPERAGEARRADSASNTKETKQSFGKNARNLKMNATSDKSLRLISSVYLLSLGKIFKKQYFTIAQASLHQKKSLGLSH